MNDWGEDEMGDGLKFSCWTGVPSGLKLSSSLGSWGGNSKPCDALAMRWHDWNVLNQIIKCALCFVLHAYENKFFHVEKSVLVNVAEIPNFSQDVDWQLGVDHVWLYFAPGQFPVNGIQRVVHSFVVFNLFFWYAPVDGTEHVIRLKLKRVNKMAQSGKRWQLTIIGGDTDTLISLILSGIPFWTIAINLREMKKDFLSRYPKQFGSLRSHIWKERQI